MGKNEKLIDKVKSGKNDKNIRFNELVELTKLLGFFERIKGSHHIYYKDGISEILNFQPDGQQAKPYQVRQLRNVILNYGLEFKDDE